MLIVIPARYDSTRFPGKPLAKIHGKPLIEWTWRAAQKTGLRVIIATDSLRILEEAERFGAEVTMTGEHENGTERVAEVAQEHDAGIVINWQGDAPLIAPGLVLQLAYDAETSPAHVLTPVIHSDAPGYVSAVMGRHNRALYFSRAQIPHGAAKRLCHLGVYAYQEHALRLYAAWKPGELERQERLEQIRWLENGALVQCVSVSERMLAPEVNEPGDIAIVAREMEARGLV